MIIGNWDKKGLVEKTKVDEKIEKILIKKIEGPENVFEEKEYEFKIVEWSKKDVKLNELIPKIKWGYTVDAGKLVYITSKALIDKKANQIVLKWKVPKVEGGKIAVYAWLKQRSEEVKVEFNIVRFPFYFDRYKFKGLNTEMTQIANDLCYGDGVSKTDHFKYTVEEIANLGTLMKDYTMTSSTKSLWNDLTNMITNFFSVGELEAVALLMVDKFKKNSGEEFSNLILTKKVSQHFSTQEFCKNIEKGILERLKKAKGEVEFLFDNEKYKNSNRFGRPQFSTLKDKFAGGLTICINDTWAYEVLITNCKIIENNNYAITYKIILYDHFGLDYPDLKDKIYYDLAGFRAWFVLQHLKSYKPFITKVEIEKSVIFNLKTK